MSIWLRFYTIIWSRYIEIIPKHLAKLQNVFFLVNMVTWQSSFVGCLEWNIYHHRLLSIHLIPQYDSFLYPQFSQVKRFRWKEGKQRGKQRGTGWFNWVSHHCHHINDFYVKYIKEGFGHFFLTTFFSCHILTLGRSDRPRFCNLPFCALGQVTLGFTFSHVG